MFLLVSYYASAQFYPGYANFNGPYNGLQHFFAPSLPLPLPTMLAIAILSDFGLAVAELSQTI